MRGADAVDGRVLVGGRHGATSGRSGRCGQLCSAVQCSSERGPGSRNQEAHERAMASAERLFDERPDGDG
jgi:hypothetical protein